MQVYYDTKGQTILKCIFVMGWFGAHPPVPAWCPVFLTLSGLPAVQPALVEDQHVRVGAGALRDLGWRFYHLHDQHLRCGAVPAHRLPGGGYAAPAHSSSSLDASGTDQPSADMQRVELIKYLLHHLMSATAPVKPLLLSVFNCSYHEAREPNLKNVLPF